MSASLAKNLKPLTKILPRPVITWEKQQRIIRNKEIWDNPSSVVHRLPRHYQDRYWRNHVLADKAPVHYRKPEYRLLWDDKRKVEVETEEYPILTLHCPEQDQGLWGGERIVKGYYESKPYTRKKILPRLWIPHLWYPTIFEVVIYSEILDYHMRINCTERALRLIDAAFGLDSYLLETPDIDIDSRLGIDLKRHLLITLAKESYYPGNQEQRTFIKEKYTAHLLPLEEAEWYGLDLNAAARKQQDIEDNTRPTPLKYFYEQELIAKLKKQNVYDLEDEQYAKPQKSIFGEKMFGGVMKRLTARA